MTLIIDTNTRLENVTPHIDFHRIEKKPISTDGVFANMSAKPGTESNKSEETVSTYEEAAAAYITPPYWQTTNIAGIGDVILVEDLLLRIIFLLFLYASFQFVGFMLTYLLHTSHASKVNISIKTILLLNINVFHITECFTVWFGYISSSNGLLYI
ncbi:hypothetical protein INT48_009865 [Thamnidium elegans]|uniref:Uncharacterized protein n=1 Tax=Thamnidium elegans TaxID=101142 RepID=A0A8H7SN63_9FUNG|nr:hypothetical protein INT48_009865 [Thamnidium elegans]